MFIAAGQSGHRMKGQAALPHWARRHQTGVPAGDLCDKGAAL
jgi:hypothetical protein